MYYCQTYESIKPVIYLEKEKRENGSLFITITIRSSFTHATKRGLNKEDF